MSRYLGTFMVAIVVILGVLGLWWYETRPAPNSPSPSVGQQGGIYPGNTTTVTPGGQSSPSKSAAIAAVLATYRQALAQSGNYDHVTTGTTVVSGNFALQEWKGDHAAGEALLKYNPSSGVWSILDAGGGEWTVAALMKYGTNKKTALILLSGIHARQ